MSCVIQMCCDLAPASTNSPIETEKIAFEGKVVQKLECRPTGKV